MAATKIYPLNFRTTKELRQKLEASAAANGRSLAEEVEVLLQRSFENDRLRALSEQDRLRELQQGFNNMTIDELRDLHDAHDAELAEIMPALRGRRALANKDEKRFLEQCENELAWYNGRKASEEIRNMPHCEKCGQVIFQGTRTPDPEMEKLHDWLRQNYPYNEENHRASLLNDIEQKREKITAAKRLLDRLTTEALVPQ